MAATSHDFWLANLTAPVWKTLHMFVYVAYAAVIVHVVFGVLQSELNPIYVVFLFLGLFAVLSLHLIAGLKESGLDKESAKTENEQFIFACNVEDIPENRARIISCTGERVAIFKYEGKISAIFILLFLFTVG